MPLETLTITAGGRRITAWTRFSLSMSVDEAVRSASLAVHTIGDHPWPDDEATIRAGGDLLLTGYVRDWSPGQDVESWGADISFVSRTVDATEPSVVHPTGGCKNKDIGGIAKEFDTCGVGVVTVGKFEKHERHQVVPGESLFSTLEPLAFADGALIFDTPEGKLKIANKLEGDHSGGLAAGVNIISGQARFSGAGRFSETEVRGQQMRGSGAGALRLKGKAADSGVPRYRPRVIVLDTEATAGKVKKAAEWQACRAAGLSVEATIVVKGWRDAGGQIWTPNKRVYVRHPRLDLDQMMAIKAVTLDQDTADGSDGTTATLTVVDPRALGGAASGGKSGRGWAAPAPKAEYEAS